MFGHKFMSFSREKHAVTKIKKFENIVLPSLSIYSQFFSFLNQLKKKTNILEY